MAERKVRHAHEMEAAGEPRWTAKFKDGLLIFTDEASGEEFQATAFTRDGDTIRFAFPGEGLRVLKASDAGFEEVAKVVDEALGVGEKKAAEPKAKSKAKPEAKSKAPEPKEEPKRPAEPGMVPAETSL